VTVRTGLAALAFVALAGAAKLAGWQDVTDVAVLTAVLTVLLPSLGRQQDVIRSWVGEEPLFPPRRGRRRR
jgi:hypothetical protein